MKKTKLIAMHLPQFHSIPENDEWWGQGFTEWTNVRKAQPLYEGHYQPRIPAEGDYYDLSEKDRVISQMKCAAKYGINGFCFYHYWFNGRKLLEKPVENLLDKEHLPIDFCLCWANEPWTRTWDGVAGRGVTLIAQEYGGEEEWRNHFKYLLPFFRHKNYLKVENKPVFLIYSGSGLKDRKAMQECWDSLAIEAGFNGVLYVYTHRTFTLDEIPMTGDAWMDFEPFATTQRIYPDKLIGISREHKGIAGDSDKIYSVIDYEKFCEIMIDIIPGSIYHYLGFFVGWDNSARVGNKVRWIFDNNTPDIVERFFREQYMRSCEADKEFLFINAWNEWGESTYLEADERYGYGYLEAISKVVL